MAELAAITKDLDFQLEQVQDFTPTPMTVATEIYYSGYHPYTGERIFTAKSKEEKKCPVSILFFGISRKIDNSWFLNYIA